MAIVNSNAGTAQRQGIETLRKSLAGALAGQSAPTDIVFVDGPEIDATAKRAFERARAGEIDVVAVGGGDATIRAVAARLAGSDVPLAILPLGTLNHFAKDLGIPADIDAAVAVIASGPVRTIDVGAVNDVLFINNSSIGLYPYMVVDRERRRNASGMAKWAAMTLSFFRAVRRFPRRRLLLRAEGAATPYRTPFLFVSNNEYDLNFLSLGRKQLDAGKLFLYVTRPLTFLGLITFGLRAGFGLLPRDLDRLEVDSAEIVTRTSRLLVAFDGEVEMMATPLRYIVRPGALKVIVPP